MVFREEKQNHTDVEIYRLVTKSSVEEVIADVMERKLILDYALVKNSTESLSQDCSILRHILENGCR